MLHTEFQGRRSIDSGEEDFQRFLPYMSVVAIVVTLSGRFEQTFVFILPLEAQNEVWLQFGKWRLRRCSKLSHYVCPGSKVKW